MKTLTVEQNSITYLDDNGKTHYYPVNYIAYSRADKDKADAYKIYIESIHQAHLISKFIIFEEADITDITLNGVVQSSVSDFINEFNSSTGMGTGGGGPLYKETITIAAGGDKTFATLTKKVGPSGAINYQFDDNVASPIQLDMTITMQIRLPGMTWLTLNDADGSPVTQILTQASQIIFPLWAIPPGSEVRPLFETDTTGDIDVGIVG